MNFDLLRIIAIIVLPFIMLSGGIALIVSNYVLLGWLIVVLSSVYIGGLAWMYLFLRSFKM